MRKSLLIVVAFLFALPLQALHAEEFAVAGGHDALAQVLAMRPDLQAIYDATTWKATLADWKGAPTLQQWAVLYGAKEYPELLPMYAPPQPPEKVPTPLIPKGPGPAKLDGEVFDASTVTAHGFIVIDAASRQAVLSYNADNVRPIASLTKLMTSLVALDHITLTNKKITLLRRDEVGGSRLRLRVGTRLTIKDAFYSMLLASANNAANMVARATGLSKTSFVRAMNARAAKMGLAHTVFADPTGINPQNQSTPREYAAIATAAFNNSQLERITTTPTYDLYAARGVHVKNSDTLLLDNTNGLTISGGKTGYLPESAWNLAVRMMDGSNHPLLIVVFGSDTYHQSFIDAQTIGGWVWSHYQWPA